MIHSRLPLPLVLASLTLLAVSGLSRHTAAAQPGANEKLCSPDIKGNLEVDFVNNSSQPVSFHWMDFKCTEGGGPSLAPGKHEKGITHPGHVFLARGKAGQILQIFKASDKNPAFVVDDKLIAQVAAQGEPYTEGTCSPNPAGRFTVEFINHLNEPITMQWIGLNCEVRTLQKIAANGKARMQTSPGHVFRFIDSTGRQLRSLDVSPDELTYHISDD